MHDRRWSTRWSAFWYTKYFRGLVDEGGFPLFVAALYLLIFIWFIAAGILGIGARRGLSRCLLLARRFSR